MYSNNTTPGPSSISSLNAISQLSEVRAQIKSSTQSINDLERNLFKLLGVPDLLVAISNAEVQDREMLQIKYEILVGFSLDTNAIKANSSDSRAFKISLQQK